MSQPDPLQVALGASVPIESEPWPHSARSKSISLIVGLYGQHSLEPFLRSFQPEFGKIGAEMLEHSPEILLGALEARRRNMENTTELETIWGESKP